MLTCQNNKEIHGDIVNMPITYISINNKYLYISKNCLKDFPKKITS